MSICLVFCYCYERLLENRYCFRLLLNIGFATHSIFIKLIKDISVEILKYGKDFYAKIGQKGGRLGCTGGFAANPALAKIAGAKGGRISRRGPAKNKEA